MPSKAYQSFGANLNQVDKLLHAFVEMRSPTRGRKHLDHFTRAALMFLCSAWEVYIEQVANESASIVSRRITVPDTMPLTVKKELAKIIKTSKNELTPITFANDWKAFYLSQVNTYTSKLNTPKKDKVMELFNKYLGISGEKILIEVPTLNRINTIVSTRGQIAHNVYAEEYLTKETVDNYKHDVEETVKELEILLWNYLRDITNGKRPWQNTY